jgi:hypothetical protein
MFNFAQARVKCVNVGATVHVVKALIGMKEATQKYSPDDVVLSTAISYIKALEAEVTRLESKSVVVNVDNFTANGSVESAVDNPASRGLLGRLFMGGQS